MLLRWLLFSRQTWVGNKRRKIAAKVDQNGGTSHSLSSHGLAGGQLSNHTLAGGALSNHSMAAGALLPAEMAVARNIQNRMHLLPPSLSFPTFSSASSSPSSSSPPLSSGSNNNNNNNDVILTGIYSLNSVPCPRPRPADPPGQSDPELSAHTSSSLINQVLHSSPPRSLHSKLLSLAQNHLSLTSGSGPLVFTAVRKVTSSLGEAGVSAGAVPLCWTKQFGTAQTTPFVFFVAIPSSASAQTSVQPPASTPYTTEDTGFHPSQKLSPWTETSYYAGLHFVRKRRGGPT